MPKRTIEVHAEAGKTGPIYRMEEKDLQRDRLEFKGPDWDLSFEIQRNDLNLRFQPVPTDAFWASTGTCPARPSQVPDLTPLSVTGGGRKLRVRNANGAPRTFHFSLNFVGEDNGVPRRFDPVIENRNGPAQQLDPSLQAIVGAAIVGAAALIGLAFALRGGGRRR